MSLKKKEEKTTSTSISEPKKEETTQSIEALISALSSEDDEIRVKARYSLVAMGNAVTPSLGKTLESRNALARWEAAKALGEIGTPEAAPFLVKALEDEEFDVRWLAAIGLIGLNIRGLKPLLHALMEQSDSVWIREGAHHIIYDLNKGELRKYLAPVLAALETPDPAADVPKAAFRALEMLEEDRMISDTWKHSL